MRDTELAPPTSGAMGTLGVVGPTLVKPLPGLVAPAGPAARLPRVAAGPAAALPVVPGPVNAAPLAVPTPALPGAPGLVTVMPAPPLVGPLLRDRPVLPISAGLKNVLPEPVLSRGAPVVGSMQWVSGDALAVTPVPVVPGGADWPVCANAATMLPVTNAAASNRVFIMLASMTGLNAERTRAQLSRRLRG